MFSKELKRWIHGVVKTDYSGDINADINLFEKSLSLRTRDEKLEGINEILPEVLQEMCSAANINVLRERMDKFVKIEPFLRHLFGIIEPERYEKRPKDEINGINAFEWTLAPLLKQAFTIVPMGYDLSKGKPEYISFPYKFAYNLIYAQRNNAAHYYLNLTQREIWEIISACLIVYLDICGRLCIQIEDAYTKSSINDGFSAIHYCKEIIRDYNRESKCGFTYVDIKWKAANSSIKECITVDTMLNETQNNLVKILGEAGCGKTTIMRQLEYLSAKRFIAQKSTIIPVFIPLGSIEADSSLQKDIKSMLCQRLKITPDLLEDLLSTNSLRLYLDGFNEILDSKTKKQIAWSIDELSRRFPEITIFLSDRSLVRPTINVMSGALEYKLFPLDNVTKEMFIKSNCSDDSAKTLLLHYFNNNPSRYESFSTPIKLKQLIELTISKKFVPEDFDSEYIQFIFDRELNDKKDENVQYLEDFACALAISCDNGMPIKLACACLAKCKRILGYTIPDSLKCLNLLIEIGILSNEDGIIEFKYSSYRDYFWMAAYDNQLAELLEEDI